jgi:hypothetical protein
MENNTDPSFWNKPQAEMTMSDSLKFTACVTIISIGAPVAALMAVSGVISLKDKIQEHRKAKKAKKTEQE